MPPLPADCPPHSLHASADDRARRLSTTALLACRANDRARRLRPCGQALAIAPHLLALRSSRGDKRCTPYFDRGFPVLARPFVGGALFRFAPPSSLLSLALRVLDFAILVEGHLTFGRQIVVLIAVRTARPELMTPKSRCFPRGKPTPASQRHSPAARAQPRGGIARRHFPRADPPRDTPIVDGRSPPSR